MLIEECFEYRLKHSNNLIIQIEKIQEEKIWLSLLTTKWYMKTKDQLQQLISTIMSWQAFLLSALQVVLV